ncbi:MAG: glycosyltransferase family 2 protein [Limnobacter sp.]|uniref:glycosyltransferase family 2 protein n=1 Tax=Limnobacter sp. TaxID=2003368 RepID=UPI003918B79F
MDRIEQSNALFAQGAHAEALNGYLSHLDREGPLSAHACFNARLSLMALREKALRQAQSPHAFPRPHFFSVTALADVPLQLQKPAGNEANDGGTWVRIDFIILPAVGIALDKTRFSLNLLRSPKIGYSIQTRVKAGEHSTLLVFVPWGVELSEAGEPFADAYDDYCVSGHVNKVGNVSAQLVFEASAHLEYRHQLLVQELSSGHAMGMGLTSAAQAMVADYFGRLFVEPAVQSKSAKAYLKAATQSANNVLQARYAQDEVLEWKGREECEFLPIERRTELAPGFDFNLETLVHLDHTLVLSGWVRDPGQHLKAVRLALPGDDSALDITGRLYRFARSDLKAAFGSAEGHFGFVACVPADGLVKPGSAVEVQFLGPENKAVQLLREPVVDSADYEKLAQWSGLVPGGDVDDESCDKFFVPLFSTVLKRQLAQPEADVSHFGPQQAGRPSVSVIIPLYGPVRFEINQIPVLAALRFPGMEVIFAIDDPQIVESASANIQRLSALYGLNTVLVVARRNYGFATINNLAAKYAQSENLLFLNSDCFLTRPQSLFRALSRLEGKKTGAVGFRLLYPDNTIQHNGMSSGLWRNQEAFNINLHPGMGDSLNQSGDQKPDASATMLTAACLLMKSQLFHEIGGFNPSYLRGDFEDSDLCLQLLIRGYRLAIVQSSDIYHLERQSIGSQEASLRQKITLVNSYLYTRKWRRVLAGGLPSLEVLA